MRTLGDRGTVIVCDALVLMVATGGFKVCSLGKSALVNVREYEL